MTITFLVIAIQILCHTPTRQHFILHRQMCFESILCNHTWVAACGKEKNDNSIRTFLDKCDMFEYNCDNRKEYFETNLDNCQPNENENTVIGVISKDTTAEVPNTLNTTDILIVMETTTEVKSTTAISKSTLETATETTTPLLIEITSPVLLNNNTILSTSKLVPNSTLTLENKTATMTSTQTVRLDTDCTRNTKTTTVELPNQVSESVISSLQTATSTVPITTQSMTTESTTSQFKMTKEITTKTTPTENTTVLSTAIQCAKTQCCCCCSSFAQGTEKLPEQIQSAVTQHVVTTNAAIQSQSNVPIEQTTVTISSTIESIQPKTKESTTTLTTITEIATVSLPRNVTTEVSSEKNIVTEKIKDDRNHTDTYSPSSPTKCNKTLPSHCNVPVTWETTSKGETRDFYQILRARFGDKVAILRDTTHWPKQKLAANSRRNRFVFGRHNDT